jgi:hypothetical protein
VGAALLETERWDKIHEALAQAQPKWYERTAEGSVTAVVNESAVQRERSII